ncbi:MAG: arsenic efflux protein [Clostridium sp.]|nr:arsenic efflux protein [Clostridium sp.]
MPWVIDAIKDSIHMLPFLFIIFVVIEVIEYFYSSKINQLTKYSGKAGPLVGSIAASFPQCGFSVIASTLYTKKLITKGTLLAVYLSTSDEAIPVILAEPSKIQLVIPLLITKIIIAIAAGYFIDFIIDSAHKTTEEIQEDSTEEAQEGCCHHHVNKPRKRDLLLHPIEHTLNVFVFVLIVTLGINYLVNRAGGEENLGQYFLHDSIFQPILTAIAGLIPNCAVSIAITLMYLKGAIGFGSVIAGLSSSAGLGILVLLKKNENFKDTVKIILLLLTISIFSGIIIQTLYN